jgi:hypothetical protein
MSLKENPFSVKNRFAILQGPHQEAL